MTGAISLTGSREPDPLKICEGDKLGSLTALLCRERKTAEEAAGIGPPISASVSIPGHHTLDAAPRVRASCSVWGDGHAWRCPGAKMYLLTILPCGSHIAPQMILYLAEIQCKCIEKLGRNSVGF